MSNPNAKSQQRAVLTALVNNYVVSGGKITRYPTGRRVGAQDLGYWRSY
jgi:hypothetical protein